MLKKETLPERDPRRQSLAIKFRSLSVEKIPSKVMFRPLPSLRHSWPFKCSTARHMTQEQRRNDLTPTPFCEEKRRLIEEFLELNHVLMNLQNQQTQAVINQDPEFSRFDDLIHLARENKDQAKYALIAHVDEHHC
jgi:hypothetical protein